MNHLPAILIVALSFTGCSSQYEFETTSDHPGNSSARQSNLNTPSVTLAKRESPQAPNTDDRSHSIEPVNDLHEEHHIPATPPQSTAAAYPLDFCLVSDEKLGSMGKPVHLVYQGQTMKFCCKACLKTFNQDPEKYIEMLNTAKKDGEHETEAAPNKNPKHGHKDHDH